MKFSVNQKLYLMLLGVAVLAVVGVALNDWYKKDTSDTESNSQSFVVQKNIAKDSVENSFLVDRKYVKIMNLSKENYPISDEKKPPAKKEFPKSQRFQSIIHETLKKLSYERIELFIRNFSSFNDPDYESDSGVKAAEWLISQIAQAIRNNSDYPGNVTIIRFLHSWKQPTVIMRFEGTDPTIESELVLLGTDLDTKYETNTTPAPGDNGGGSAVLLETTRVLLATNFVPKRSIELHWYASGEEEEQRGQTEIAEAYTRSGLNVYSILTLDTICYDLQDDDGTSSINKATKKHLPEFTFKFDDTLEAFLRTVVKAYFGQLLMRNVYCETGCVSDETSWSAYGVTAAWPILYPCEMHPKNNSHTILNIYRAINFARLANVYTIETAEPYNINS